MLLKRESSPYWYVVLYQNVDGKKKKKWLSTKTTDKRQAQVIEKKLRDSIRAITEKQRYEKFLQSFAEDIAGETVKIPGVPLDQVWEQFSNLRSQQRRTARTMESKQSDWNRFIRWLKKNYPECKTLNDITKTIAYEYMKCYEDKAANTYNNVKNNLSSIWHEMNVPSNLKENIWRTFSGAGTAGIPNRPFSDQEVKKILKNTEGFWHYATKIAYYTGLRKKDICFLKWKSIKKGMIKLVPEKTRRKGKAVVIHIHPELQKVFDYLPRDNEYLFPEIPEIYDTNKIECGFSKILKACKIKANEEGRATFHSLRTTFITRCEEAGIDRKTIQGIVGHGSPAMTEHYSHDIKSGEAIKKLPALSA